MRYFVFLQKKEQKVVVCPIQLVIIDSFQDLSRNSVFFGTEVKPYFQQSCTVPLPLNNSAFGLGSSRVHFQKLDLRHLSFQPSFDDLLSSSVVLSLKSLVAFSSFALNFLTVASRWVNRGNFDEKYWRKGTNHELNDLKLQTKNKKKTRKLTR